MTIKGTLETFNLRELLQMLSFNQKVGTLMLATDRGPRSLYVEKGQVALVAGDPDIDSALEKVLVRKVAVPDDRMRRARELQQTSARHLSEVLQEMGVLEPDALEQNGFEAASHALLTLQLTSVSHFEFVEGGVLGPDGTESRPLAPWLVVDSLLLDLTRKMDQWVELNRVVPGMDEIFESSGIAADVQPGLKEAELSAQDADAVFAEFNGYRTLYGVAEAAHRDELTAMQVAAVYLTAGAIRAVPTAELATRGEDL